jgi:hypothetical protein
VDCGLLTCATGFKAMHKCARNNGHTRGRPTAPWTGARRGDTSFIRAYGNPTAGALG